MVYLAGAFSELLRKFYRYAPLKNCGLTQRYNYRNIMIKKINKQLLVLYLKNQIHGGISDLRAYTKKIEEHLEDQKLKIEERNEKEYNKIDGDKEVEKILTNLSVRLGYGRHIEIFTKSAIVSIYTYLEFLLDDFCKKVHKHEEMKISPKDFSGSGIFRSKLYLSKVVFINFDKVNSEWEEIIKFNEIRNFLVHSNGVASSSEAKTKILKTIDGVVGVSLKRDHIKVSQSYIYKTLSTIEKFLKEIEVQYSGGAV